MKFASILFLALISTSVMSATEMDSKTLNKLSDYESRLRKYKSQLELKKKQVKSSTIVIKDLNEQHSKLVSSHRQLIGEVQFLKYQNDQLIEALKQADSLTPELASKFKVNAKKGRLPASVETKKSK